MIAMTYPIHYIHNNKDTVAIWRFILPSFNFFSQYHTKTMDFHPFFSEMFSKNYFLQKFNSQIAGNDRHELEIMFEVSIVLFLFVDISIIMFEKFHRYMLNIPIYRYINIPIKGK